MDEDDPILALVLSMARAVAGGHRVVAWATHKDCNPALALAWARLPGFKEVVLEIRAKREAQAREKITGKKPLTFEQLLEVPQRSKATRDFLEAAKAVQQRWCAHSECLGDRTNNGSRGAQIGLLEESWEAAKKAKGKGPYRAGSGKTDGARGDLDPKPSLRVREDGEE